MTPYLALWGVVLLAAAVLAGQAWLAERRDTVLRRELREAHDRLYGAWQAGAQIPPRSDEAVPAPEPLPAELQPLIDQWSSPDVRSGVEDRIRRMLARQMAPSEIARVLTVEQASRTL